MIRNYFVILFRTMARRKFYTFINVLCLTVGFTFTLVAGIFIYYELKVNQDIRDVDRLYLVTNNLKGQQGGFNFFSPPALSKSLTENFPLQFSDYYRFWERNITVSSEEKHFRIQCMMGDESFIDMFGFRVIDGDSQTPLSKPGSAIITDHVAQLFFGRSNVAGESLTISTEQKGKQEYKITAVIAEPQPKNTVTDLFNMQARIFLSLHNASDFFSETNTDTWNGGIISYVKLGKDVTEQEAKASLEAHFKKHAPDSLRANSTIGLDPVSDYYLITNHGAVSKLLFSLGGIVLLILTLAVSNFVNISITSSFARLKEVAIRKSIGSEKRQLIIQFLLESIFFSILAMCVSLVMYELLSNPFGQVLNTSLPSITSFPPQIWGGIMACTLIVGIIAGMYPAIFQSGTKPIDSLKGKSNSVQGTISFSRVLITSQFVITLFIFTAAIVLSIQTDFFLARDLGYKGDRVIVVTSVPRRWDPEGFQRMDAASKSFLQSAEVKSASLSWGAPALGMAGFEVLVKKSGTATESAMRTNATGVDHNFANVYNLDIVSGEFFNDRSGDTTSVVLNEEAASALKVSVGDKITITDGSEHEFTVMGITRSFNYESMHEAVKPLIMMDYRAYGSYRFFSFRINASNNSESVAKLESVWRKVFPDEPFNFTFADEKLQSLYATELQLKKASSIATVLMLVIVLTGIVGFVSLTVSRRNKEIGIRKVLGATIPSILFMISGEYAKMMIIAFVLGLPAAYLFASKWLENFVYHIDLEWWMFAVPCVLLLLVTTSLVILQSYRTATTNPVKSLRYE